MIVGVGYHYVRPDFSQAYPAFFGLTPDAFREQLRSLARLAEFIGPEDLRCALRGETPLPERAWLVTFDDGLREQYEWALPVLDELGIPAIFFANTQPLAEQRPLLVHMTHLLRSRVSSDDLMMAIEAACHEQGIDLVQVDDAVASGHYAYDTVEAARVKYLLNFGLSEHARQQVVDWCFDHCLELDRSQACVDLYMSHDQMRDLAKRGWLGSHTHSHRPLGLMTVEDAERDIRVSLDLLADWTGCSIDSIGYPYGSLAACPPWLNDIGLKLGLAMGFTMERAGIDAATSSLLMPRCAPNDLPGGSAPRWREASLFEEIPASTWYQTHRP